MQCSIISYKYTKNNAMVYQKSEIFFCLITIALVVLQRNVVEVVGWGGYKHKKKGPPQGWTFCLFYLCRVFKLPNG